MRAKRALIILVVVSVLSLPTYTSVQPMIDPVVVDPQTGGPWYAGIICSNLGLSYADKIQFDMKIPSGTPNDNDYYYVIGSCFDNNNNFIQVGLSTFKESYDSNNIVETGGWWFCYSTAHVDMWGTPTDGYHDEMPYQLQSGRTYRFVMEIGKNPSGNWGYANFYLYEYAYYAWYLRYSVSVFTNSADFIITNSLWFGFFPFMFPISCFWIAEEIHYLDYPDGSYDVPTKDFKPKNIRVDGSQYGSWWLFSAGVPSGQVELTYSSYSIDIDNSPFS